MIKNKFTKFEIAEYLCGWLLDGEHWFDLDDIEGALSNAKSMLRDEQDGIVASNKGKVRERVLHDD